MSEFDKLLIPIYEAVKREKIRCICIFACVVIVLASVLGATVYYLPPPSIGGTQEPVTYSYTTEAGQTITTTINGSTTTTIVTDASGRVISTSITSGRRTRTAAQRGEAREQRAAARAERRAQREARRLERQAARLERQVERARARTNR